MGGLELDRDEIEQGLNKLLVRMSAKNTNQLFASADKDGGGTIDGREFTMIVRSLFQQSQFKHLKADQMHVIIKCSLDAHREEFVKMLIEVQQSYRGRL